MKIRVDRHLVTVRWFLSLAVALSTLSGTTDAVQHRKPQTGHGQSPSWEVHFPAGTSMVEVPFREVPGMIYVDVRVNGSDPFAFVIETGWSAPGLLITEDIEGLHFDFNDQGRDANGGRPSYCLQR